jgi:hypothetical protein
VDSYQLHIEKIINRVADLAKEKGRRAICKSAGSNLSLVWLRWMRSHSGYWIGGGR